MNADVIELDETGRAVSPYAGFHNSPDFKFPVAPGIVAVVEPGSSGLVSLLRAQDLRPGMTLTNYEVPNA